MLNKVKYREEIIKLALEGDRFGVSKANKLPVACGSIMCEDCIFYEGDCTLGRKAWLNSEYKEPERVFTEEQKNVLRIFDKIKYIARDKSGDLWGYVYKPQKGQNCWYTNDVAFLARFTNVASIDFPQIKWKDKEPTSREEILGE